MAFGVALNKKAVRLCLSEGVRKLI
jgi:hypothetical protein